MHTERFGSYMDNRILIVEDEEKIARFLELELRHEGYDIDKASNGRDGLDKALTGQYALMVLDVMLPELNGFEVLRRLRKNSDMPVIMLTARDTVMDKVAGLDGGADDYMTKPFAIEELLARIRLALKKRKNTGVIQKGSQLTCKGLNMDVQRYELTLLTGSSSCFVYCWRIRISSFPEKHCWRRYVDMIIWERQIL